MLLTYSIRIWAGDGNPIITATILSENGIILDILRTDLEYIHDGFYQPTTYYTINKDFDIKTTLVIKEYAEENEKFVLTDSTAIIKEYDIDSKGKFKPRK